MSFSDETRAAAAEIIARYPEGRSRSALLPMLHLVQAEEGYVTPAGHRLLRRDARADQGRGRRGRDVLHDVQAAPGRRVPGLGVHQPLLPDPRRRGRLRPAVEEARRPPQRDHRRRHVHPRARRVPGGLRLRAGRHGQLRVLRQRHARQRRGAGRRARGAASARMPTRGAPLCSFKEISRQLAGFRDPRPEAVGAGVPTRAGDLARFARHETKAAIREAKPTRRPASRAPRVSTRSSTPRPRRSGGARAAEPR